ncbi:MAG: alpha-mannosidase [Clostridia bacterium]|nr:alpha-mannosidase [Clostridia bacterium]
MAQLHLIGNAHLDPVWLWRWQEGFSEILNTFRSALDRMKEFPDFKFTSACAVYYEWVEKTDPAMFEEIKQRVAEGRWNIAGGWFLQPDCNAPAGESFARHALISQRYFRDKLGVTAETGYNVDSFGHNASLPQILRLSGMNHYVFMRPGPHENPNLADIFLWESADGSAVPTYRIRDPYCITSQRLHIVDEIREKMEGDGRDRMAFYGVGNHGGGPTVRLIRQLEERGHTDEIFSTPDEFFAALDPSGLPVVRDELQHHARGCYSTVTRLKKGNRRCENNLLTAEAMCVLAGKLAGMEYPREKLTKAWKNVLFNQFHDIMGGCSIKSAYDDAAMLHGEVLSITEKTIARATALITMQIDTLCGTDLPYGKEADNWRLWDADRLGTPFVVFNPHPWPITETVQTTAVVEEIRDPAGNAVPMQRVRGEHTNGGDKFNTAFTASVPAYGYAVYRLHQKGTSPEAAPLTVDERTLENDVIRVTFGEDGELASFTDKRTGKEIVSAPCSTVLLDETDCDTWAHNKVSLGETVATFGQPEFFVAETGAVRATLWITTRCGASTIRREYSIAPGSDRLNVKMTVDFHEKHRTLKLAFPAEGNITAAIPYGSIVRPPNTGEEPCGWWLAADGLGFASDFACGYDTENGMLRPTVLRGAIFADHFGQRTRDEFCEYMDMGVGVFTYALFPYTTPADAERRARTLNTPAIVYSDSFHHGPLGQAYSGFASDNDSVTITAIKGSEEGEGAVIRFFDADGADGHVSLTLLGHRLETDYRHHEIKSLRTDGTEVDLLEFPRENRR